MGVEVVRGHQGASDDERRGDRDRHGRDRTSGPEAAGDDREELVTAGAGVPTVASGSGDEAAGRQASPLGRNFMTVKRLWPTGSSSTRKSCRVVTKWAAPSAVDFCSLTDSSMIVDRTRSPSTRGRSWTSSESPPRPTCNRRRRGARTPRPAGPRGPLVDARPGFVHTSSMASGATICPNRLRAARPRRRCAEGSGCRGHHTTAEALAGSPGRERHETEERGRCRRTPSLRPPTTQVPRERTVSIEARDRRHAAPRRAAGPLNGYSSAASFAINPPLGHRHVNAGSTGSTQPDAAGPTYGRQR